MTCFSHQIPWFPSWLWHWQDEGSYKLQTAIWPSRLLAKVHNGQGSDEWSGDLLTLKANISPLYRFFIKFGNRKRNALTNPETEPNKSERKPHLCSKYVLSSSLRHYMQTWFCVATSLKEFGRLHLYRLIYISIRGDKVQK